MASGAIGVALIQMNVVENKAENLATASRLIRLAVQTYKPRLVVLPESFNTPHGQRQWVEQYAEPIPSGETVKLMSDLAKELNIYLVAGTIPEKDGSIYYNTSVVFGPNGNLLTKYRQVQLARINVPNKTTLNEKEWFKAGNALTYFDMDGVKVGLAICTDLRYPELATVYRKMGVQLLVYTLTHPSLLGQHNVELLTKARALDTQLFVVNVAPARNVTTIVPELMNYGHSMIVDPTGNVLSRAGDKEDIVYQILDLQLLQKVWQQDPIFQERRNDIYELTYKK